MLLVELILVRLPTAAKQPMEESLWNQIDFKEWSFRYRLISSIVSETHLSAECLHYADTCLLSA